MKVAPFLLSWPLYSGCAGVHVPLRLSVGFSRGHLDYTQESFKRLFFLGFYLFLGAGCAG